MTTVHNYDDLAAVLDTTRARADQLALRLFDIISRVELPPEHRFVAGIEDDTNVVWFELTVRRPDTYTEQLGWGRGGRRQLRGNPTDGEIARALFGAYLAYVEHEAREAFKVDGLRVFGPHISLDALLTAAGSVDA